jgi:hypothetical protein
VHYLFENIKSKAIRCKCEKTGFFLPFLIAITNIDAIVKTPLNKTINTIQNPKSEPTLASSKKLGFGNKYYILKAVPLSVLYLFMNSHSLSTIHSLQSTNYKLKK